MFQIGIIIEVAFTFQSIWEEWVTPFLEAYKQQQIYWCFRSHIHFTSLQRQLYTDWELHESYERRTMSKLIYSDIIKEFGVPKTTLWRTLNVLLPSMKYSSVRHHFENTRVVKSKSKRVIEVIRLRTIKDKEAYMVATLKIKRCTWTTKILNCPCKWVTTSAQWNS